MIQEPDDRRSKYELRAAGPPGLPVDEDDDEDNQSHDGRSHPHSHLSLQRKRGLRLGVVLNSAQGEVQVSHLHLKHTQSSSALLAERRCEGVPSSASAHGELRQAVHAVLLPAGLMGRRFAVQVVVGQGFHHTQAVADPSLHLVLEHGQIQELSLRRSRTPSDSRQPQNPQKGLRLTSTEMMLPGLWWYGLLLSFWFSGWSFGSGS